MFTQQAFRTMAEARWIADAETEASLTYVVECLTQPDADGTSELERIFRTYPHENERNHLARKAGWGHLKRRFRNDYVFFAADCPDDGRCRFHLAVSDVPITDSTPQAHRTYFLNLLREHADWIVPPGK